MRKPIAAGSLYFTSAPITPREVTLRFSNILVLVEVFRNGYKNSGIWAKIKNKLPFKNYCLVWWCNARHCNSPTTRQIRLDDASLRFGGGDNSE